MISENSRFAAEIQVFGDVMAPDFPGWIARHALKLGLQEISTAQNPDSLRVDVIGPEEMLDALALACSLGPASVLVDSISYATRKCA